MIELGREPEKRITAENSGLAVFDGYKDYDLAYPNYYDYNNNGNYIVHEDGSLQTKTGKSDLDVSSFSSVYLLSVVIETNSAGANYSGGEFDDAARIFVDGSSVYSEQVTYFQGRTITNIISPGLELTEVALGFPRNIAIEVSALNGVTHLFTPVLLLKE